MNYFLYGAIPETVSTAFSTGITEIVEDVLAFVVVAVPAVLGLVGVVFAIKKGISFFKNLANKA